ncbi:acyl carrier protein [Pseudoduganella namucuonensis]|uniref:Acyl carrier protein n=1 Tax=Pseudoduganella namucuonensis TaxID=1035707 RepID=A0A1I7GZ75_9BURK|nr:acyl carrier protein [Pseudoduganella namucuonensis]SFU53556.1 Acyl carrier protein [Pseudoduganella namucuonensis]
MTQANTQASQPAALIEVSGWLIEHLEGKHPEMRGQLHKDMSFDSIGLDSLARVELISAMERRFGVALEPTLAYDFVTAGALSAYVWGQISGTPVDQKHLMGV